MNKKLINGIIYVVLVGLAVAFLYPLFFILNNSFKGKFFISSDPFGIPTSETFVAFTNYVNGIEKTGMLSAIGYSFFITIVSVVMIILFTSMTAYYITRVKSKLTSVIYYMFTFSMIVPFQMVMFTMTSLADTFHLRNPLGMCLLYLGFGSGLSVFMFSGFVKSIPLEIEEASMIDGATPPQIFWHVILPMLKSQAITIGILEIMWIWNDYLLPYLTLGSEYKTIPIAIQYLRGGYGAVDWGAMMAMLVLAMLPVIVFYAICQKHIIKGVLAGAVKG